MKWIKTLWVVLFGIVAAVSFAWVVWNPFGSPQPPVRALWVTRFDYATPEDVCSIIDNVAGAGFTDVFFQIRGNATVFYKSRLEPWAYELSGDRWKCSEAIPAGIRSSLRWTRRVRTGCVCMPT